MCLWHGGLYTDVYSRANMFKTQKSDSYMGMEFFLEGGGELAKYFDLQNRSICCLYQWRHHVEFYFV